MKGALVQAEAVRRCLALERPVGTQKRAQGVEGGRVRSRAIVTCGRKARFSGANPSGARAASTRSCRATRAGVRSTPTTSTRGRRRDGKTFMPCSRSAKAAPSPGAGRPRRPGAFGSHLAEERPGHVHLLGWRPACALQVGSQRHKAPAESIGDRQRSEQARHGGRQRSREGARGCVRLATSGGASYVVRAISVLIPRMSSST